MCHILQTVCMETVMKTNTREEQLYDAFLKAIRSVGLDELKKTSMFIRSDHEDLVAYKKAA